ncbi:MAG: amidohydrolase family protein [Verrucomicrobiota bacterium]
MLLLVIAGLLAFLLFWIEVYFKGPISDPVDPPSGILDMHCHTAGIGAGGSGARISDDLRNSWKFGLYLKIFGSSEKRINELGDAHIMDVIAASIRESRYVDNAVILAMDAVYDEKGEKDLEGTEVYVPNRFVGEETAKRGELLFGASVHPNRKDALEELEWSKTNGAVFVKWLPNIQSIDPSDEGHGRFYSKLVELDLPLLTHVGDEDSFSKTDNALGDPKKLEFPLSLGVKIIAAHVASSGENEGQCNVERLLELMPRYPNLAADISTLTQFNRKKHLPKVLSDDRLKGRLMYGTDYPLTNTPLVTPWLFFMNLRLSQIWRLSRIQNSWDRDVELKAALGVRTEVFELSRSFLGSVDRG